jgi:hypothetical protein
MVRMAHLEERQRPGVETGRHHQRQPQQQGPQSCGKGHGHALGPVQQGHAAHEAQQTHEPGSQGDQGQYRRGLPYRPGRPPGSPPKEDRQGGSGEGHRRRNRKALQHPQGSRDDDSGVDHGHHQGTQAHQGREEGQSAPAFPERRAGLTGQGQEYRPREHQHE